MTVIMIPFRFANGLQTDLHRLLSLVYSSGQLLKLNPYSNIPKYATVY